MEEINNIPSELLDGRQIVEGSFIFSLWKEPELFGDYIDNINPSKFFIYDDAKFYYSIGASLYKLGYENFDETTIMLFLKDMPSIMEEFQRMGGMGTVNNMKAIVSIENIDIYYDELIKINSLIKLNEKGFNVVKDIDKFKQMNSEQVADYYDYLLNDTFLETSSGLEIDDLVITQKFIDEMDKGMAKGLQFSQYAPLLNYHMLGIPKGDLTMIAGHSGTGKTSFVFANIILPIVNGNGIQGGEYAKACIISNEQRIDEFQLMLSAMELYNEDNYLGLTRKQIKMGNYTKEQRARLESLKDSTNRKYKDKLKFVRMYDYDTAKIKRTIKKLSKVGYELFVFDTMKSQNLEDNQFWQGLVENSKELFQLVDKENVALVTTYQLALHSLNMRYLNASCLSNAKQIKEVYSEMVYFRQLWEDEYTGEQYDVKAYNRGKNDEGKYTNEMYEVVLDPNKKYLVAFIDKTRNDEVGTNIIYEWNGAYNSWKEIGYCKVQQGKRY